MGAVTAEGFVGIRLRIGATHFGWGGRGERYGAKMSRRKEDLVLAEGCKSCRVCCKDGEVPSDTTVDIPVILFSVTVISFICISLCPSPFPFSD